MNGQLLILGRGFRKAFEVLSEEAFHDLITVHFFIQGEVVFQLLVKARVLL
jgi:hypothetical protein